MPKVINIESYYPKFNECLFFDNNIWMYLFCPIGNYELRKQKAYTDLLKRIDPTRTFIFINSLVLSEFCNRWLRLEFNTWRQCFVEEKDYKRDFIATTCYKEAVIEVKDAVKKILSFTQRSSDNFQAINFSQVLSEFENIDFNDSYYISLALLNKWKIVTDDTDFLKCTSKEIEIITANRV